MIPFELAMMGLGLVIPIEKFFAGSEIPPEPSNAYVAEDGTTYYVAEDGLTFYVQES